MFSEFRNHQERCRHMNVRKIPGTPAGCSWDTRRDKQGSTGQCPRDLMLLALDKLTEKSIFAAGDAQASRVFPAIFCELFLCAFSAP